MSRNRYAVFFLWIFLAFLSWGAAFGNYLKNYQGNQEFTGYYDRPVLTGKKMDIFMQERKEESLPFLAAWKTETKENISGKFGSSCQGRVLEVRGEMRILFPRYLIRGNFPWNGDEQGCVISLGMSRELFGTDSGIGNEIQVLGETYLVRGILKEDENLLAIWAGEEEELENFRLSYDSDLIPVSQAEELLYQMTGAEPDRIFEGNLYGGVTRFFLFLPVLSLGGFGAVRSFYTAGKQRKLKSKICRYILTVFLWVLFLWILEKSFRFSSDYFPSMWSDFSFYPQILKEKTEIFQELISEQICGADSRILTGASRSILLSAASFFFLLLAAGVIPQEARYHFYSFVYRIKEKRGGRD